MDWVEDVVWAIVAAVLDASTVCVDVVEGAMSFNFI